MSVEQQLREALHGADDYEPSPDLFARVQRSIEEHHAHRRRLRLVALSAAAGLAVVAAYLVAFAEVVDGRLTWPWWSLELLTTALMATTVVVLGPLIRRFGRLYAAAVFQAHPPTATRFLALLDVAYYLVFTAGVLMTTTVEPEAAWLRAGGLADQLAHCVGRYGELLLLMGVLHSLTIALLPGLGLVFADGWRRLAADQRS